MRWQGDIRHISGHMLDFRLSTNRRNSESMLRSAPPPSPQEINRTLSVHRPKAFKVSAKCFGCKLLTQLYDVLLIVV